LMLLPLQAHAASWNVDQAHSKLSFTGKQSGDSYSGSFARFTPEVEFGPVTAGQAAVPAKIKVSIDMLSVKMGTDDQQDAVTGKDFFDVRQFAQAVFVSEGDAAVTKNGYSLKGNLTLKGVTQPVTLNFTLKEAGGVTTAEGEAVVQRNALKVGVGDYASDGWIAYPVTIHFTIAATPKA
jgi:polyisoprenoid-binding protein YceI